MSLFATAYLLNCFPVADKTAYSVCLQPARIGKGCEYRDLWLLKVHRVCDNWMFRPKQDTHTTFSEFHETLQKIKEKKITQGGR